MNRLPKKPKIKTTWDLTLFYKSPKDPQIEKDIVAYEKACSSFEKKYKTDTSYTTNEKKLLAALKAYEKVSEESRALDVYVYFNSLKDLDSSNADAQSKLNQIQERFTKAGNKLQFFSLALGKIPKKKQSPFLKSSSLKRYHYYLERLFLTAKHDLSEEEEKIMSLLAQPSHSMWVEGVEKVLSQKTVPWKGTEMPIDEALSIAKTHNNRATRKKLREKAFEKLYEVSDFAEAEINAVYTRKKISDELRGYDKPYESTIHSFENRIETVEALVKTVTENFALCQRFLKLKTKLLGYDHLYPSDIYASIGTIKRKFSFEDSVDLYREVLYGTHTRYGEIFDQCLSSGRIDVFPKKGKTGGAYHMPGSNTRPGLVLLNHTNDLNSFGTLTHEMGHAIHSERANATQPEFYRGYSTAVAETASTFFENIAATKIMPLLTDQEKIVFLEDRISSTMATIFRQITIFNFEKELHQRIRSEGYLQKEDLANLLVKHLKAMDGKYVDRSGLEGYFFVYWSHIRRFFYVYSYAHGDLISKALTQKYLEDPSYIDVADRFMAAGGSMQPEDIFKDVGIDITKPSFWESGIKNIEKDVDELEKLIAAQKK